jgi:hypothetical protein
MWLGPLLLLLCRGGVTSGSLLGNAISQFAHEPMLTQSKSCRRCVLGREPLLRRHGHPDASCFTWSALAVWWAAHALPQLVVCSSLACERLVIPMQSPVRSLWGGTGRLLPDET